MERFFFWVDIRIQIYFCARCGNAILNIIDEDFSPAWLGPEFHAQSPLNRCRQAICHQRVANGDFLPHQ
jgi:hypothetical protein